MCCLRRGWRSNIDFQRAGGRGLVFTPDGKGLFSSSRDRMVMHWDVSWLTSTYDDQKEDGSKQDPTGGLRELSRFVGHEVRRLLSQSVLLTTHVLSRPIR